MLLTLALPPVLVAIGQEGGTLRVEKQTNWPSHPSVWHTCDGTQSADAQVEHLCRSVSGMLTCRSSHQAIAWTVPELGGVR